MSIETHFENGTLTLDSRYAAPREEVFAAWTEAEKTQAWWGCADCTAVRSEIEPRVGGRYNHHMTLKNQFEVPGDGVLTAFEAPTRLAYKSTATEGPEAQMVITVDFEDAEEGTRLRLAHSGIPDMKIPGDIELWTVIQGGWSEALKKLHGFLEGGS